MGARPRLFASSNSHLVPGLPNSVVQDCVIPRIPWHVRPRLKAVSKAWSSHLQDMAASFSELTRQESKLEGLIMVHQVAENAKNDYLKQLKICRWMPKPHALSIYDEQSKLWRQLPPIPAIQPLSILHDCGIACVKGKLFVMGGWDPKTDAVSSDVYMIDLAGGLWQWEKRSSMHTPKAFFYCKSVAGIIYVVGGSSSQNQAEDDPLPEAYDAERDEWMLLPKVTMSRSFHYNGLAAAGTQVLAYGFCTSERGELVNFWRVYDPVAKRWSNWECDLTSCSSLLAGDLDLRDGVVNRFDASSKTWIALDGKVYTKTWRWEGSRRVISDSTCAHSFFVVKGGLSSSCSSNNNTRVYATICEGDNRCLTIWRGDIDYASQRVSWKQLKLPGSLAMCSEMCYLD